MIIQDLTPPSTLRWLAGGLLILSLLFLFEERALAEAGRGGPSWPAETTDNIFQDYRNFYSGRGMAMLGIGATMAGGLANTEADREFREWYQDSLRSEITDDLAQGTEYLGRGLIAVPLLVGAAVLGELTRESRAGSTFGAWGERSLRALLVGAPPTILLQYAIGGSRPTEGSPRWRPFDDQDGVSGHSFIGATPFIVAAQMTPKLRWKIPLYLASALVGLARINEDAHYLSQVSLGWWMAYLAASSVEQTESENRRIVIAPAFPRRGIGAQIVFRY